MKHKLYKSIFTYITIFFLGSVYGQKFDKKYTENFIVNKDVVVAINASNTEVNVTTWNKNEVQIEAFIDVEGLSKEEAEKYFKNSNFEALGNKSKVKISASGNNPIGLRNDFVIHDNMNFTFPDIKMPDFDSIVFPEMNFDFDINEMNVFEGIENFDQNVGKNGDYSFNWNDGVEKISIKTKEEWEAFKKSKKYKEIQLKMSEMKEKFRNNFAESKEKMKIELAKARLEYKKIDKEELKRGLAKAKKQIKEMKLKFNSNFDDVIIDGKKIKINKRLEIKVPKGATFDLNTRHSKVKLPNSTASGNVKYGSFDANRLSGGNLNIDFSKVTIADLNACTLFLNNVTDAKIASVTNTNMNNNSSIVVIETVNENVDISDRFGQLTIQNIIPNYQTFKLMLDNSEVELNLSDISNLFTISATSILVSKEALKNIKWTASKTSKNTNLTKGTTFKGTISAKNKNNTFKIEGENSKLTIIKENL